MVILELILEGTYHEHDLGAGPGLVDAVDELDVGVVELLVGHVVGCVVVVRTDIDNR